MTTKPSTETTKQRIFVRGVEHQFKVGQQVRINPCAVLEGRDKHGDVVRIEAHSPLGSKPAYRMARGGWYEEKELEAILEDATPKPDKFFLVLSEENAPGGAFDTYASAWEEAVRLAKEPGAVPQFIFEAKGKVVPVVDTAATVY